jgi:3-deoxy-D-manno-octulosonate 8-phosphate phosphatase (KDO 8-P phosphatase)
MTDFQDIERRAARIKLLLMDCDGVLTDGQLTLLENGDEQKTFNVRDGHGIVLLHRAGLKTGIISGRKSTSTDRRAQDLGISYVIQNSLNKIKDFEELLASIDITESEIAFVGDDVTDIPLMQRAELAVAVADATEETRNAAHWITNLPGGYGAVREVAELILKAQGRWHELMARYIK